MLKVATWNVNSLKARLDRVLAFLERERPDVVCLQELKGLEEIFPFPAIQAAGYEAAVFGQKTYNGVAVLSRHPLTEIHRGFGDNHPDVAARFLSVKVLGVTIISAYIPNGQAVGSEKYAYKMEWFSRLESYFAKNHTAADPILLCGDFNVAPEDRDVHDPMLWEGKILFSEPEKAALRKIYSLGFQDTYRLHHSESGHFSWWDYRMLGFQKNHGMRIDFILATHPLAKNCRESSIDRNERKGTGASDHAPVIATFAIPE